MAGGFLLYALRLLWLRRREAILGDAGEVVVHVQPAPQAEPKIIAAPRIQLEDYETVPPAFAGAFHSPLAKLRGDVWWAVWYVLATLALVTLLLRAVNPTVLFIALQIPLVALCSYVVAPDANVARRLPLSWLITALLALFVYQLPRVQANSVYEVLNNVAGFMAGLLMLYWLVNAGMWSVNLMRQQKDKLDFLQGLELVALLAATWGAVFEIASLLVWIVLGLWRELAAQAPSVHGLFQAVSLMKTLPALRFLPLEIVLVSLLVLTALRMRDDHYEPRSLDEFLPIREESFFAPFVMAVRIPVWIVVVIIEFSVHFARLAREAAIDFARKFAARLGFVMISFALAPLLFYFGHTLMLQALDSGGLYFASFADERIADPTFLQGMGQFFLVNVMILLALCCYALAVPLLAARYRRVLGQNFVPALQQELIVQGKPYVLALGKTFSLLGVLPFAIPVVSFLPDNVSPGVFSFFYALMVLAAFAWHVGSKDDVEEYEEEEYAGNEEGEEEPEASEPRAEEEEADAVAQESPSKNENTSSSLTAAEV